jgi:GNAT superfamily N-acetyltransferase
VYSYPHDGTGGRGVLVLYGAHSIGGALQAGDDATEVRTFGPEELPEDIAFNTHQQALRDWRRSKAIICREATAQERVTVASLDSQYRAEIGHDCPAAAGESALYIAADRQRVIGFAYLTMQVWNDTAKVDQIFVLPNYRRWGIATQLIAKAIEWARQKTAHLLMAEVVATSPALAFYLRAGFRVTGFLDGRYAPGGAKFGAELLLAYDLAGDEQVPA